MPENRNEKSCKNAIAQKRRLQGVQGLLAMGKKQTLKILVAGLWKFQII